jgi:hypothetical protein
MGLIDWKFVFKRRKWILENYLSSCNTIEEAIVKFKKDGMISPSEEVLASYMTTSSEQKQAPPVAATTSPPKKSFDKSKVQNKKRPQVKKENSNEKSGKYDDIIVLEDQR